MVKGNKQTTDIATEMTEMRALIERLFGELNARLDKFDQQILELKKCIESSRDQEKGEKMVESAMNPSSDGHENLSGEKMVESAMNPSSDGHENSSGENMVESAMNPSSDGHENSSGEKMVESDMNPSSDGHENSSMPQEEQMKRHREPITATYSRKRTKKKDDVSPIEDDDTEIDMVLAVDGGFCVTGYHGERPLAVLMGEEGTTHNFINESLADKLGCETVPIEPRTVRSDLGELVTSRVCNNFQLSMEGTVFNLKLYLLPLSSKSKFDMVLGEEWLGTLEKVIVSIDGMEFYLQGTKQFMPFKKSGRGRRKRV